MKCSIFGFKLPHKALYVHLLSIKWCMRNQRILSGMLSAIFGTECQAATGRPVTASETAGRVLAGTPWKARLLADSSGAAAPVRTTSDGVWVTMQPRPHCWESLRHSSNFVSQASSILLTDPTWESTWLSEVSWGSLLLWAGWKPSLATTHTWSHLVCILWSHLITPSGVKL